jgi:hypothetical protein
MEKRVAAAAKQGTSREFHLPYYGKVKQSVDWLYPNS